MEQRMGLKHIEGQSKHAHPCPYASLVRDNSKGKDVKSCRTSGAAAGSLELSAQHHVVGSSVKALSRPSSVYSLAAGVYLDPAAGDIEQ